MAKQDSETYFRYSELDVAKIDRTARTIPVSFSSEYPALQKANRNVANLTGLKEGDVFIEVLDHAPENVDLSLLNNRGAFLDEHEESQHLGVVEKAEINSDKRGLAIVKMGSDDQATKRFTQMADNIRPHISAGYKYTRYLGKEQLPNGRAAHRFAWRGLEISSVAVPNDPTVGVGMGVARAYQDLPQIDSQTNTNSTNAPKFMTPEEIAAKEAELTAKRGTIIEGAINSDRERRKKIRAAADAMAAQFKTAPEAEKMFRSLADKADVEGVTVEAFNEQLLAAIPGVRKLEHTEANLGMTEKDLKDYSLTRAIRSCIDHDGKIGKDCPEFDLSAEAGKKYGRTAGSFWIPSDVIVGRSGAAGRDDKMQRDLQAGVFGQGGGFVPTNIVGPIIELLRNKMVLRTLGIRVLGGLTGNVAIPRQTGAATAYSLSEIAQVALSTQVIDQIALTPKRIAATGNYSKQLLIQSSVDVENFMREDLMEVMAIRLDLLGFTGSGAASEPLGIINTPGVGSVTFAAAATYAKMVNFETQVNAANSLGGSRAYVTTPTAKGVLKSAAKLLVGATTVTAVAIWEGNEINGYPAQDTNQIPGNLMVFGNFNSLILGMFGGIDVVVDPYTLSDKAEVKITTNTFADYAIRHPQEFVVSSDSAAQ